ncbi:MAG TPA: calcium/proton exchanger [Chloroflexia bacterium]|nr:calcium/proton exchanger [Chloroflexia bacterium]
MATPHVPGNPTNPPNAPQHAAPDEDRMSPAQEEATRSPLLRALAWIGLDLTGPGRSAILQIAIYSLLVFIPIALAVKFLNVGGLWLFITASAAIIPLAKILGHATEELAVRVGSGIGGLLNATFGNAVEMIIAFFALQKGLYEVVKASITGSILGNVLFVLGLAIYLGGLGREKQVFNRTAAGVSSSQLILGTAGLFIPAAFALTTPANELTEFLRVEVSIGVALILLGSYLAQLIFSLRTHKHLYGEEEHMDLHGHVWSTRHSIIVLVGATVLVAFMAEILIEGVEYLTHEFGMTELFVGVILVALIGNAAEHLTAVVVAMKNKMDLAVSIALGSTLQVALFVAPVLVLIGFFIGRPLDLFFNLFELAAIGATMLIVNAITQDGESNWFEGVQLLAAYAIIAVAFFFHP